MCLLVSCGEKRMRHLVFSIALAFIGPQGVFAFGADYHHVSCKDAYKFLAPSAKARCEQLPVAPIFKIEHG